MVTNIGETIGLIDKKYIKENIPEFDVGDTVKMKIRVQEAEKERFHPVEGTVIRKTGKGLKATFTIRKLSYGEGVEVSFPINSPVIDQFKVISKGIVHRAKLYYLRDRIGKKARVKRRQV